MAAREDILGKLRAAQVPAVALPDLSALGVDFPDLRERFALSAAEVGGRCVRLPDASTIEAELARIPEYASANKVASLWPGVRKANVDLDAITDPHAVHDVDFAVLVGDLGVAENGAIWITNHGGSNRAVCYLSQHLAVVLRGDRVVKDLHDAYTRISIPAPGFAMWLSGPSKTADIEQALVIGAHGARSCTVLLVG